jgi:hypothetical protein
MESVLINVEKKSDISLLLSLAQKMGLTPKALSKEEIEDWKFAQQIEKGMKTTHVSREEIMKALGK